MFDKTYFARQNWASITQYLLYASGEYENEAEGKVPPDERAKKYSDALYVALAELRKQVLAFDWSQCDDEVAVGNAYEDMLQDAQVNIGHLEDLFFERGLVAGMSLGSTLPEKDTPLNEHDAYIKLYGAAAAALQELNGMDNSGAAPEVIRAMYILQQAIAGAEDIVLQDDEGQAHPEA